MSIISRVSRILRARLAAGGFAGRGPEPSTAGAAPPSAPAVDRELAGYYANLEVPYGSDLATVKEAWKRLMRKYHPDLHSSDSARLTTATELVKKLNHAYEELARRLR